MWGTEEAPCSKVWVSASLLPVAAWWRCTTKDRNNPAVVADRWSALGRLKPLHQKMAGCCDMDLVTWVRTQKL
jgi:hypothetical protein